MTGNEAGQSAGEMAQRARDRIARLQRSVDAWDAGAAGEQETGRVLADLDPTVWRVLHDVGWPGRARANIDHIVVGPPGVFVIDTKNWSGTVAVEDGVLRQNGRSRERYVAGVAEAAIAVLQLVPGTAVHPVICLVRDEPAEGLVRNVRLCSTGNIREVLASRPQVMDEDDVRRLTAVIEVGVARPEPEPRRAKKSARPEEAPAAKSRPVSGARSRRSLTRALIGLVLMALLIGGVQTGLYFDAFSKVGDFITSQLDQDDPPADEPAKKPGKKKQGKRGQGKQQGQKRDGVNRSG